MRPTLLLSTTAAAVLLLAGTPAARAAEVSREVLIDAAPGRVWQVMGPFCSIAEWHPLIARCVEESIGGEPHRRLTSKADEAFVEKLVSHDTDGMSYSYDIVESPLPLTGYKSTLSVADAGEGRSRVTWRSTFEPTGSRPGEAESVVAAIYEAGLSSIKDKVVP